MKRRIGILACTAVSLTLSNATLAAVPVAYPAKGQSGSQQQKDEASCKTWAINKSGFNPDQGPPPTAKAAGATGSGAGVKGAAVGAGVGAISGGDAGEAAVAGAVAGRVIKRNKNRREANEINSQNAAAFDAGMASYQQARGACMSGRGYTMQ